MLLDPSLPSDTSELKKLRFQKLWALFKHNFEIVQKKGHFIKYPNSRFKYLGIPSPRQYIIWYKLINLIGTDKFRDIPVMEAISHHNNENILTVEKYTHLLNPDDEIEIIFVCGLFWHNKKICRENIMNLLSRNFKTNKWKLTIHTNDKTLEKEFIEKYSIHPKIYWVPFRIDLHYTIIKNKTNPEKSFYFLELPHTENFFFRLFACFSFTDAERFDCKHDGLLQFLAKQPKQRKHVIKQFFTKSLPSFFNIAVK